MTAENTSNPAEARITILEAALVGERARVQELTKERDQLRASHERLRLDLELLRRRIFVAKAERADTAQLEIEFKDQLVKLDTLCAQLEGQEAPGASDPREPKKTRAKPKGRRDLRAAPIAEVRVELADPVLDLLVTAGKAERIGFEESCKLAWQRGGHRRLVVARVKYRVPSDDSALIATTPMPAETFPRSLAAPSLLAHIITEKYCDGLPLYRIEDRFARDGVPVDRGTMCRWVEDAGATAGATVINAARDEAMRTAFCLATDATGVAVQPIQIGYEKGRQACRHGHYFVQIADRDHVFYEFTPKETSEAVSEMFRGFSGYVQADAKSVYDILFRDSESEKPPGLPGVRREVACWVHGRRGLWEATIAKNVVAREGLAYIGRIFALDEKWQDCPPAERKALRDKFSRIHVEHFFAWAEVEHEKVREQRGQLRSALGYLIRQKAALMCFLEDGRLLLDNNRSERALRRIAVGRKAWLFVGSDDHAQSAGHLFSLVASARLHRLDPEAYLRDLFRVLAQWPRDRYLELAPKFWAAIRARLNAAELQAEVGPLSIPPAPAAAVAETASL